MIAKPTDCTFHYAFDLICRVNHISDHLEFSLLEAMNWRGVTRGYLEGNDAIWITDCACQREMPHVYPRPKEGHVTIAEREYLMAITQHYFPIGMVNVPNCSYTSLIDSTDNLGWTKSCQWERSLRRCLKTLNFVATLISQVEILLF